MNVRCERSTPGRSITSCIEAAGYYACLHAGGDTHVLRRSLSELERDLDEEDFIRIHRSIIVNLDRIRGLELQAGGEYEVVLSSKGRLRLSRRYRKRLQERMGQFTASCRGWRGQRRPATGGRSRPLRPGAAPFNEASVTA